MYNPGLEHRGNIPITDDEFRRATWPASAVALNLAYSSPHLTRYLPHKPTDNPHDPFGPPPTPISLINPIINALSMKTTCSTTFSPLSSIVIKKIH